MIFVVNFEERVYRYLNSVRMGYNLTGCENYALLIVWWHAWFSSKPYFYIGRHTNLFSLLNFRVWSILPFSIAFHSLSNRDKEKYESLLINIISPFCVQVHLIHKAMAQALIKRFSKILESLYFLETVFFSPRFSIFLWYFFLQFSNVVDLSVSLNALVLNILS